MREQEILKIVIPVENHPSNIPHLIVLLYSIREQVDIPHEVIIVNHNDSVLPDKLLRFIKHETLINIKLTNDKYYYKNESYFLLKPEVLRYVSTIREGPYLLCDPDNLFLKPIKKINKEDVHIFNTPTENNTKLILSMFDECYPEDIKTHFNTPCIYTYSREFIKDWYNTAVIISKHGINMSNSVVGRRFEHYCEELAITIINNKNKYNIINDFFGAYLDELKVDDCTVYHYDYYDVLRDLSPRHAKIYKIYSEIKDENTSVKGMILSDEKTEEVYKELICFIRNNVEPILDETKRILRWELRYNFNE